MRIVIAEDAVLLRAGLVRLLTEHVPAKANARRKTFAPTKAMNFGSIVHSMVLGAGPELIVYEHDGRTKPGKEERALAKPLIESQAAVGMTKAERQKALDMVDALRSHAEVVAILDATRSEVSGFWQEGGAWMRSRYDLLSETRAWDYKTAQDSSRRGFQKAMADYGYHQQAEFYLRGLTALGHPAGKRPFRFIVQETEAPYLAQIHTPDDEAMETARELNDRAIRIFVESNKSGIWAGYPELAAEETPLPNYYYFDHEELLGSPETVELKLS